MKRFLQLLGEMSHYRLPQAKLALQELAADDELVIVVPEQALAGEIQQWATSQGMTVAAPKKILDGLPRWQLSIKNVTPVPVEAKPAAVAPTAAATPAPAPAPAAVSTAPSAAPTAPASPAASSTPPAPAATPAPAPTPTPAAAPTPVAEPTPPTAPAATAASASVAPPVSTGQE